MLNINPGQVPVLEAYNLEDKELRKRAKILEKCKQALWKRWTREYVRSLRERHVNQGGRQASVPRKGSAVIIQDDNRNRKTWKLGIVLDMIKGKDGVVRGAKVKTVNGVLERAIQQLYPLELTCDDNHFQKPDPQAPAFVPREKRDSAAAASLRIEQQAKEDKIF
ncbi:uncharacterized protein LOC114538976 [Dendronephthya gigantea]|uniref:uncharacterized protein LOC114538976 n=1 Tax=Dendronephthya gigantea TaxID=151771 RepID=UPI00106ADC8A|nr:uncharacterized protein LOC114538976 [Dendronephthya gigantea]